MRTTTDKKILMNVIAILHDAGKIKTIDTGDDGKISFKGHENESVDVAKKFLSKMRFSNNDSKYVETIIKYHQLIHTIASLDDYKK